MSSDPIEKFFKKQQYREASPIEYQSILGKVRKKQFEKGSQRKKLLFAACLTTLISLISWEVISKFDTEFIDPTSDYFYDGEFVQNSDIDDYIEFADSI